MKKFIVFLALQLTLITQAQVSTISLDDIATHEGQVVTICEKVTGTHQTNGNNVFLNFGKPFPNHAMTIVIFAKDLPHFSYEPKTFLLEKTICVTGKIISYKGKFEIIVNKEEDIVIASKPQ